MQLPHLRKLTMDGIRWTRERLTELKQLSQLRDLHILIWTSNLTSTELIQFSHRIPCSWSAFTSGTSMWMSL